MSGPWLTTDRGTLWHGNALEVYQRLSPGSFELVISDGPYGIGKDRQWDPGSVAELPALYEPHVAAWDRLCKPAASVYFWGTAASWAAVHPVILAHGWRFRALVVWEKGMASLAGRLDTEACRTWPDVTEVCGLYHREAFPAVLHAARSQAGLTFSALARSLGTDSRLPALWEGYPSVHGSCAPNRSHWDVAMRACGRPDLASSASWQRLGPVPFTLPHGVTNVWRHPLVGGGERLRAADGSTLHPCQKPLAFYRRMIRASTRPGANVLEPFGGTCRAAVAAQQIGDRRAVCVEMDEQYLRAVRPALQFVAPVGGLFGGDVERTR